MRLATLLGRLKVSAFFPDNTSHDALMASQRAGLDAERRCLMLQQRLDRRIWFDIQNEKQRIELEAQVRHWTQRAESAEQTIAHAVADRDEAHARIVYLEQELADTLRSRDELLGIADGLRTKLNGHPKKAKARR
jgi:hypothetical protein